ncbi:hypothetical protein Sste5346_005279 [Sporothrix stenoceras]|uniref:Protein kinase domain-containing protein n=1 Tax=Sporothrix stenoceras TaxID=5173 RepID=A0ABR3Z4B2_9PEZI
MAVQHGVAAPADGKDRLRTAAVQAVHCRQRHHILHALTNVGDIGDIGVDAARIVGDPRTLNKYVFTCTEMRAPREIYDIIETLSGEKVVRNHVPREDIAAGVAKAEDKISGMTNPDPTARLSMEQVLAHPWWEEEDD